MNEQNEIHCEGINLSLEFNYIPQILVPTMCKVGLKVDKR